MDNVISIATHKKFKRQQTQQERFEESLRFVAELWEREECHCTDMASPYCDQCFYCLNCCECRGE
jgi:hypothetical protein